MARAVRSLPSRSTASQSQATPAHGREPCRRGPIDLPPPPLTSPAATSVQVLERALMLRSCYHDRDQSHNTAREI
ncbi:hypothetical protein SORBI_3007G182200 [Sorghum bicolor]|uniref:Uncharacterized protein n=1 Tax=Sorghum bicolor TaxID=4558 RepID=C5YH66_SORBI|nr:hypothetical protein SORBI_3007G182200 [Sorghum bicolor]